MVKTAIQVWHLNLKINYCVLLGNKKASLRQHQRYLKMGEGGKFMGKKGAVPLEVPSHFLCGGRSSPYDMICIFQN